MFFDILKTFFTTFGAPVFVPVIIFVIALCLKVKPKKAFVSALSAAVGLMGFFLLINAYAPIITPIINGMVKDTGVNLPVFDVGWQTTSIVAYSTEVGMMFVAIAIIIQTVLFLIKYVNVFQPGDLWNNYSYFVWGSMVYLITNNIWLSMGCMVMQLLYTVMCAEIIEKRWSTYYQYPNCTLASLHTVTNAPYAVIMEYIMNKLGLYKLHSDPVTLQKKLGFIGEPMTLGLFLGLLIGLIGQLHGLGELSTWGRIATCGVATSAVMAVFPKVSAIFAGSFTAITEASKKSLQGVSGSGREWYLSVNDATGYGETATLISGIIMMPLLLLISFILPGNETLPMIDLVGLPYLIQPIVAMSNGNVIKTVISGLIWFTIALFVCSYTAPQFSQVVGMVGINLTTGAALVTSLVIFAQPVAMLIYLPFVWQSYPLIVTVIVIYIVCYLLMRKYRPILHTFMENQAKMNIKNTN